jgi:membrane protease YdiL (CAAX protease family)
MYQEATTLNEPPTVRVSATQCADRRRRWFELTLVLTIVFGRYVLYSVYVLAIGRTGPRPLNSVRCASGLFQDTICLLLVGYVLSRRAKRFFDLGLKWSPRALLSGLGVAIGAFLCSSIGYLIVHSVHHAASVAASNVATVQTPVERPSLLAIPFVLLNPFFEELIVRAYLMTEVGELTGSWTVAVLASVLLQASYHLYYGWDGALYLSFQFLFFSIYYAKTRKAMPVIVAHGIFDLRALAPFW